jgi:hypothetical protein
MHHKTNQRSGLLRQHVQRERQQRYDINEAYGMLASLLYVQRNCKAVVRARNDLRTCFSRAVVLAYKETQSQITLRTLLRVC